MSDPLEDRREAWKALDDIAKILWRERHARRNKENDDAASDRRMNGIATILKRILPDDHVPTFGTGEVCAVPFVPPVDARGLPIRLDPGPCLWCLHGVESKREEAGAQIPDDPCWATEDGDFGCYASPESNTEGCGDHARPYDLARLLMRLREGV